MTFADAQDILLEDWYFLRHCSTDLEITLDHLSVCDRQTDVALQRLAIGMAVVTYWRPFSGNRGSAVAQHIPAHECKGSDKRGWHLIHRLPLAVVPDILTRLHREIGAARNEAFAHTDIAAQAPQVMPLVLGGCLRFAKSATPPPFHTLLHRRSVFATLATAVRERVHRKLWAIEDTREFREALAAKATSRLSFGSLEAADLAAHGGWFPSLIDLGPPRPTG